MPKLKSNSGAKKRFRVTKNGKVMSAKAYKRHQLENKSPKRKLGLRGTAAVSVAEVSKIKMMLPYG